MSWSGFWSSKFVKGSVGLPLVSNECNGRASKRTGRRSFERLDVEKKSFLVWFYSRKRSPAGTRLTLAQFWSFKIRRTTLSYIKFADLLIFRLYNCERVRHVTKSYWNGLVIRGWLKQINWQSIKADIFQANSHEDSFLKILLYLHPDQVFYNFRFQ